jgi:protocatechuate 3,4-dioxygenase beta subunit
MTASKFRVVGSIRGQNLTSVTVATRIVDAHGKLVREGNAHVEMAGAATLGFWDWAEVGHAITFVPSGPSPLMFYPSERSHRLAQAEAPAALEPIEARMGLFFRGRIEPPTAGVRVTISERGVTPATVVASAETDSTGMYSVGPLRDDREYEELFSHPGLVFEKMPPTTKKSGGETVVKAVKLAALTVIVKDTNGSPLSGVLVSLSGDAADGYHSNGFTLADGTLQSGRLMPGEYFAKPMEKEYSFKPASRTVTIVEGSAPVVEFVGERTAFSVHGTVATLDGTPLAGAAVSATGKSTGTSERVHTNEAGHYRIRGLTPGAEYKIAIATNLAGVFHAAPLSRTITVSDGDTRGADFLAIVTSQSAPIGRVLVSVKTTKEVLPTLEAVLTPVGGSTTEQPHRASFGIVPFVEFGILPRGEYRLHIRTSLAPVHWACTSSPERAEVDLRASSSDLSHVEFQFSCGKHTPAPDAEPAPTTARTSIFSLFALILIMAAAYNHQLILAAARKFYFQKIVKRSPPSSDYSSSFLPKQLKPKH